MDLDDIKGYAMCDDFHVSNETDGFKLTVGMYNGTAGNIYNTYILYSVFL